MLIFAMDGPLCWLRIDTTSLALMMPSGAVHPITCVVFDVIALRPQIPRQPPLPQTSRQFSVGPIADNPPALQHLFKGSSLSQHLSRLRDSVPKHRL
jgi:hypothetical protein